MSVERRETAAAADLIDADPNDGRSETLIQRVDRNWLELLQEMRVVQAGTQIFTGFLLAIAFQPRFAGLDRFQHTVYLVLISTAVLTTAVGLIPVTLHRALFRRRAKPWLVDMANRLMKVTVIGVGMLLTGTLLLIFDLVVSRTAGLVAGGIGVAVMVVVGLLPTIARRH